MDVFRTATLFFVSILFFSSTALATSFTCIQDKNGTLICNFPKEIEDSINKISSDTTAISEKTPTDLSKTTDSILQKAITIEDVCRQSYSIMSKEASKITISTGGTEYITDVNARIFARLLDGNSMSINLANCNATIYYPNNTKFLNNQPLSLLENGIYYYDFITPNMTGNYITIFDCKFPSSPFIQNTTWADYSVTLPNPIIEYFSFDNTNNVTINSANITVAGYSGQYNLYLNGYMIGNGGALNGTLFSTTFPVAQDKFILSNLQSYTVECSGGCPYQLSWIRLIVNYTWDNPYQMIRGQDEVHISSGNTTCSNLNVITDAITSVNDTVKNQTDFWGNTIYNFLQTMVFGGNVTANVDYDEIAITVMQYIRGMPDWWFEI